MHRRNRHSRCGKLHGKSTYTTNGLICIISRTNKIGSSDQLKNLLILLVSFSAIGIGNKNGSCWTLRPSTQTIEMSVHPSKVRSVANDINMYVLTYKRRRSIYDWYVQCKFYTLMHSLCCSGWFSISDVYKLYKGLELWQLFAVVLYVSEHITHSRPI